MELFEVEAAIEGILFSLGEAIPLNQLAAALGQDEVTTQKVLYKMMEEYDKANRGIHIIEVEKSFQMCTKADSYEYIIKVVNQPKRHVLSDIILETLSIIAYKQPITKQEIEAIRGVKSDHAVNKLVEYNLVQEVGRLNAIGRPILFGTTTDFLRSFGVHSIDDLPLVNTTKIEDFKQEAEDEIQLTLDV